jgi:prophage antirepressor-like protein
VLAEVCRVLKISNPSDAATRLDDDEKAPGVNGRDGRGGLQPGRMAERILAYAPSQL